VIFVSLGYLDQSILGRNCSKSDTSPSNGTSSIHHNGVRLPQNRISLASQPLDGLFRRNRRHTDTLRLENESSRIVLVNPQSRTHDSLVAIMAPSATEADASAIPALPVREEKTYPPAKLFNVKETRFDKYVAPQPEGREKALAQPSGSAAIVIDNGTTATLRICPRLV
jgi:hypothetical protein